MRRIILLLAVAAIMSSMVAASAGLATARDKVYYCESVTIIGDTMFVSKKEAKELEKAGTYDCREYEEPSGPPPPN
jgi:hypothetical protein